MVFGQLPNSHRIVKRLAKSLIRQTAHTTLLETSCHGSYSTLTKWITLFKILMWEVYCWIYGQKCSFMSTRWPSSLKIYDHLSRTDTFSDNSLYAGKLKIGTLANSEYPAAFHQGLHCLLR